MSYRKDTSRTDPPIRKGRRLPRWFEIELAKLLNTLGFTEYGVALWNLSTNAPSFPSSISIDGRVLSQIREQAVHEPAIVAAGAQAIPFLWRVQASDLLKRAEINVASLFDAAPSTANIVIIVSHLSMSGIDKYTTAIVNGLQRLGNSVLLVVTEQRERDVADVERLSALESFPNIHVLFWGDHFHSIDVDAAPRHLALFLHWLEPSAIVVIRSKIGMDLIARFGRPLSQFYRLFCLFYTFPQNGPEIAWSISYPRRISKFVTILTDNKGTREILRKRYGSISQAGIINLPVPIAAVAEDKFEARLGARRDRASIKRTNASWVWFSRDLPLKGFAILDALARLRPNDRFDLFAPLDNQSLDSLDLLQSNIRRGNSGAINDTDFSEYDGVILTGLSAGMPDVVAEMSQHAIPMILPNDGGISHELDSAAAILVSTEGSDAQVAEAFSGACDFLLTLNAEQITNLTVAASHQLHDQHSHHLFMKGLEQAFMQRPVREPKDSQPEKRSRDAIKKFGPDVSGYDRVIPNKEGNETECPSTAPSITAFIVFHREGPYAIPALASLADMVRVARESGIVVEVRAILDRPDEETRRLISLHGAFLNGIDEVSFGDLGLTRNAAVKMARGTFIAFLDGDDLWGSQWLTLAYKAATTPSVSPLTAWHPEDSFHFHEKDFLFHSDNTIPDPLARSFHFLQRCSESAEDSRRSLQFENIWTAHVFASKQLFLKFPYRANDPERGFGFEDWRWNLDTLESGIPHRVVPGTVHMLRVKDNNSLSSELSSNGFLPLR